MDSTISLKDLGLVLIIIAAIVAFVYLIILIRNLNESVKTFKSLILGNKENIDKTLKDLPVITDNLVEISSTARNELQSVEAAIHNITETVEATAATANSIRNDLFGKIKGLVELIDTLRRIFFKEKDINSTK